MSYSSVSKPSVPSYSGVSKGTGSYKKVDFPTFKLLIDDTYFLLIDGTYKLEIDKAITYTTINKPT